MAPKLLLIDGHSLAYRAFYATAHSRDIMATSKGEWTNAVYVFVNKLLQLWKQEAPEYIAVAFDRGKSFRHDEYEDYKANRSKVPDELRTQLARVEQVIGAFNIPIFTCEGYEADDVLGSLAKQAGKQDIEAIILTGDTDLLQLVDEHVHILLPRGRYGDETLYGVPEVQERYGGLEPAQLIDHKAMVGDNSDNIPGIRGIGKKGATTLLQQFGSIEGIYEHLDEITGKRQRNALDGQKEVALLYKDLITIRTDAPVSLDLEKARAGDFERSQVLDVFRELEFTSLIDRVPAGVDGEGEIEEAALATETRYTIVDTLPKLDTLVAALEGAAAFAFDTETTSTDPMMADLVGISASTAPGLAWYVPVGHGMGRGAGDAGGEVEALPLFSLEDEADESAAVEEEDKEPQLPLQTVIERLKPVFENAEIAKYAHNASYDIEVLAQAAGIKVRGLAGDTMIAAWVLDPGSRQLGLKQQASVRLGVEMTPITELIGTGKSQITFDRVPIADAAPYACADADMTLRLVEPLRAELEEKEQWRLFAEIEMPMVAILTGMEMAGVHLDAGFLAQMSADLENERKRIENEIFAIVGHEFNINSTKQLSDVLYQELGFSAQGIRKTTHGYSTAADALSLLAANKSLDDRQRPVIGLILDHRQVTKLKSTYVDALPKLINPRTGRVHTSYNQTGAVTGRLSSSNPNLQNIPIRTERGRQIRKAFVARKGWYFCAADYSQIELRVLAHVSQDAELLDAFHEGEDVHARTAAAVYGIPVEAVTKAQRGIAKTVNFGLIYGQSAYGLSQQTELDYDEAERFIETYFEKYPGVKKWLDDTREYVRQNGHVETLLGRRRLFPEFSGNTLRVYAGQRAAAERQAINAPIQGTAADILKIAMIDLDRALREGHLRATMVLQVHDEVVLEVPEDELDQVVALTRDVMEGAYELCVPLKVDVEVGPNWYDMREV